MYNAGSIVDPNDSLKVQCPSCKHFRYYWNFERYRQDQYGAICNTCESNRRFKGEQEESKRKKAKKKTSVQNNIKLLMLYCMKNKLSDLRTDLFETLRGVKDGNIDVNKVKVICEIAQVIINSAKVEVDFLKTVKGTSSEFFNQQQLTGKSDT